MGQEATGLETVGTDAMRPEAAGADSPGGKRQELRPWKMMEVSGVMAMWEERPRGSRRRSWRGGQGSLQVKSGGGGGMEGESAGG